MGIMSQRKARKQNKLQRQQPAPDNRFFLDPLSHNEKPSSAPEPDGANDEPKYKLPIDSQAVRGAQERLKKYQSQKASVEKRIVQNEDYWKLRQWNYYSDRQKSDRIATAWLWNCIVSKLADMVDGYPESNIRPKRSADKEEAIKLKSIIPVIFEENDYEDTYTSLCNYLLKHGTACASVVWNGAAHDGLGDVSIQKVDILELFWESGISDIQDSPEVMQVKLENNERLIAKYPQLKGKIGGHKTTKTEYHSDDTIDTSNKSAVVDWFYKKTDEAGNQVVHLCKYAEGEVLFASENEPEKYPNGYYDDGDYPFVITALFPVENSICGFGYTDIGRGDQEAIDTLTAAVLTNVKVSAKPRFFTKQGISGINEEEFADWSKDFVHVTGSLEETHIRQINPPSISSYVIQMRERFIDEMKETLGNRDVNNGGATSGITAASAIAAMQEQSGKLSRSHNKKMYSMHKKITYMVIERIRQFYKLPREFRITGELGVEKFGFYDNRGLVPQPQTVAGINLPPRLPCFDIEVSAQKSSAYNKMEQNELAIQMYNLGVFSPQNTDMALAMLQTMDFSHKDEVMQRVAANGTLLQRYQKLQQIALQLAKLLDLQSGTSEISEMLKQAIMMENGKNPVPQPTVRHNTLTDSEENGIVEKARAKAQSSTQVKE